MSIVGILADDADPMVSVMKVEKAPLESYADIGGLQDQAWIQMMRQFISLCAVISCYLMSYSVMPYVMLQTCCRVSAYPTVC